MEVPLGGHPFHVLLQIDIRQRPDENGPCSSVLHGGHGQFDL